VKVLPRPLSLLFAIGLLLAGCGAPAAQEVRAGLGVVEAMGSSANAGFARATEPRPFVFPQDHGPHPEYAIEWWYATGNLDAGARHFGYQLTIFRTGLTPSPAERLSGWAARNVYMAHFALTDVAGERFYAFERFSRDGAGLAGASAEPLHVFLEDWSIEGTGPAGPPLHLRAAAGEVAIDLTLNSDRPATLQGDRGLSQKGPTPGNASYYYSLTRMETMGTVRVGDASYPVAGLSWLDREWSTSALEGDIVGWDWFALHLDSDDDLMFYQLRGADGRASPFTRGSLTGPDGTVTPLGADDVRLTPLDSWQSPRSGGVYPSRWRLEAPALGLDLELAPYLKDQELPVTVVYWEGAVQVAGTLGGRPVGGDGYVEMTGYAGR
jgi:predicted secreted hydrolase